MTLATEFNFIPATCEGLTHSPAPIFRCNAFIETGGDAEFTYGYHCTLSFHTDRERTQHQYDEHGWWVCGCGEAMPTHALARAHHDKHGYDEDGRSIYRLYAKGFF